MVLAVVKKIAWRFLSVVLSLFADLNAAIFLRSVGDSRFVASPLGIFDSAKSQLPSSSLVFIGDAMGDAEDEQRGREQSIP